MALERIRKKAMFIYRIKRRFKKLMRLLLFLFIIASMAFFVLGRQKIAQIDEMVIAQGGGYGRTYLTSLLFDKNANPLLPDSPEETGSGSTSPETPAPSAQITDGDFSLTMLDVGQGLSILIQADGHYALYDGGGRNYSSYVVSYLAGHGINDLDYIFTSHYDEDHINGLVGVMNTTNVDLVVDPDYETDTKIYASYKNMISSKGIPEEHPSVGSEYQLGNAVIKVIAPQQKYEDRNNMSIAVMISYGAFEGIITGDAETESENDMLSSGMLDDISLYVAGHHGSSSSSSAEFISTILPEYTFISVGKDNDYGHPTEKTLNTLNNVGSKIYRSDIDGEVTLFSDGTDYWFDKSTTR